METINKLQKNKRANYLSQIGQDKNIFAQETDKIKKS